MMSEYRRVRLYQRDQGFEIESAVVVRMLQSIMTDRKWLVYVSNLKCEPYRTTYHCKASSSASKTVFILHGE
jgi:hypothetical protein